MDIPVVERSKKNCYKEKLHICDITAMYNCSYPCCWCRSGSDSTNNWLAQTIGCMVFNALFNIISFMLQWPLCTCLQFPGQHSGFLHNHCPNIGQRLERNESCSNDCHHKTKYWLSRRSNQQPPVLNFCSLSTELQCRQHKRCSLMLILPCWITVEISGNYRSLDLVYRLKMSVWSI